MRKELSIRELFACYIVVAGTLSLFIPGLKDLALICLGAACGYIAPKPTAFQSEGG